VLALLGAGCTGPSAARPAVTPERAVFERVCDVLVTAYRAGLRPASVEIEVPSSREGEPPGRLTIEGAGVPPAERCLGLPDPKPAVPAPTPHPPVPRFPRGPNDPLDSRT
jgi:hypothetical protein